MEKYIYTLNDSDLTVLAGGSPEENELPQVSTGPQMGSAEDKTNVEAAPGSPSVEPESPGAMAALNLSIIGDTKLVRAYQQVKAKMRGKGNIYQFYQLLGSAKASVCPKNSVGGKIRREFHFRLPRWGGLSLRPLELSSTSSSSGELQYRDGKSDLNSTDTKKAQKY